MNLRRNLLSGLLFLLFAGLPLFALAQQGATPTDYGRQANVPGPPPTAPAQAIAPQEAPPTSTAPAAPTPAPSAATQPALPASTLSVTIQVKHASDANTDLSGLPVIVTAARARGPFETVAPRPVFETTAITDAQGRAQVDDVPASVIEQGLRLYASASFGGVNFMSSPVTPSQRSSIDVRVYDKGHDPSTIEISNLRVIVEPWENYLVFTQYWTLSVTGDLAIDTAMIPGREFERGLPLRFPIKAEGINANGPGRSQIVNNFVYWSGVLKPGEPINLQVRFSMSAKNPTFVYEQEMRFPTRNVELVAPLQTQYRKVPRLDNLEMIAPGFNVSSDAAALGLRTDMEFLVGTGYAVEPGEAYRFQLRGLPFEQPRGGWITIALGLLAGLFVILYGRREKLAFQSRSGAVEALDALLKERETLFEQLTALERELQNEGIDDVAYETQTWLLRERLALVLKKIDGLSAQAS